MADREKLTKSQVDRLGERLRAGRHSEEDLRLLDEYRLSFQQAYQHVVEVLRVKLNLTPTGRPGKSTSSIIEKLRRESIRLSQIQDIAGCRIVMAEDIESIDEHAERSILVNEVLCAEFPNARVLDRTLEPSHGYRAVHVIVHAENKPVEIQVRTIMEHLWAEISEKLADLVDPELKYGGGPEEFRRTLMDLSEVVGDMEGPESEAFPSQEAWLAAREGHIKNFNNLLEVLRSLKR